jgi:hypothetical protein
MCPCSTLSLRSLICTRCGCAQGDFSNCRPLHTWPNALLAAAAASADAEAAATGSDWQKQHVLYGNDNHYMFFRCVDTGANECSQWIQPMDAKGSATSSGSWVV